MPSCSSSSLITITSDGGRADPSATTMTGACVDVVCTSSSLSSTRTGVEALRRRRLAGRGTGDRRVMAMMALVVATVRHEVKVEMEVDVEVKENGEVKENVAKRLGLKN